MNALNSQSARVIDPVLTGVAQGYVHAQRVGHVLFPSIPVPASGGTVIEFVRDAQTVPGIDLGKRAVNTVMNSLTLTREIEQATLATDASNYGADNKLTLTGTDCWNSQTADPAQDIEAAKDQVRATCGVEPNRMVIGSKGFKALKYHPKITERFKYTTSESITPKMLAGLFDLEELAVGKATYVENTDPETEFKEAWGDFAALAYVPSQDMAMDQPSFGYTYTMIGHPFVEQPRWNGDCRSWVYGVTYERAPVLTGIASGFLFSNVAGTAE